MDDRRGDAARVMERAAAAMGRCPLSDQLLTDWEAGEGLSLVAEEAMAQASHRDGGWTIQLVVDPDATDAVAARRDVAARLRRAIAGAGGGTVDWWVFDATDDDDTVAGELGFTADRDLWQMHRPLPAERRSTVATRAFVVGQDETAWLAVNNRAFAGHAEQSGWTIDELRRRISLAWFDPAGFLLHERDGVLAAFCWTKMHEPTPGASSAEGQSAGQAAELRGEDPVRREATPGASSAEGKSASQAAELRGEDPVRREATPGASSAEGKVGEIYVIGVDPAFQGLGLGSELTLAGLESLHARGAVEGMLYVDGDNRPAQTMYERLGFTVTRRDRAYRASIEPEEPAHR